MGPLLPGVGKAGLNESGKPAGVNRAVGEGHTPTEQHTGLRARGREGPPVCAKAPRRGGAEPERLGTARTPVWLQHSPEGDSEAGFLEKPEIQKSV